MVTITLPIGCYVRVEKPALQAILDRLRELGYRVVGPTVADGGDRLRRSHVDRRAAGRRQRRAGRWRPTACIETAAARTSTTWSAPTR